MKHETFCFPSKKFNFIKLKLLESKILGLRSFMVPVSTNYDVRYPKLLRYQLLFMSMSIWYLFLSFVKENHQCFQ